MNTQKILSGDCLKTMCLKAEDSDFLLVSRIFQLIVWLSAHELLYQPKYRRQYAQKMINILSIWLGVIYVTYSLCSERPVMAEWDNTWTQFIILMPELRQFNLCKAYVYEQLCVFSDKYQFIRANLIVLTPNGYTPLVLDCQVVAE